MASLRNAGSDALSRPLAGKVAIVTGSSRGIGRAIALRLSLDGATVVLAARGQDALTEVADDIRALGGQATTLAIDLRDSAAAETLVRTAVEAHGRIDIVINNAGGGARGELADLDDQAWADAFDLKMFGAMRLSRAAWPQLARNKGAVINIIGVAGRTIPPGGFIIAAQCGGYYALTKALAEMGLRDGVQVNGINPGPVRTGRLQAQLEAQGVSLDDPAATAEGLVELARTMKVRRIGEPEDIAALVAFILSPHGDLFHGSLIDFDGGAVKGL